MLIRVARLFMVSPFLFPHCFAPSLFDNHAPAVGLNLNDEGLSASGYPGAGYRPAELLEVALLDSSRVAVPLSIGYEFRLRHGFTCSLS